MFVQLQLVVLLILSGSFTFGKAEQFGDWNSCSQEPVVLYSGCNVTVKAVFNMSDAGSTCSEVYINFSTDIGILNNGIALDNKLIEKSTQPNGTVCMVTVSGIIVKVTKGANTITFYAKELSNEAADTTIYMSCNILIEDVPPPLITLNVTCNGVQVEWEKPLDGITLEYTTLNILGTNIMHNTSKNNLSIQYSEGLEYHKHYNISVAACYCNGMIGNFSTKLFYTAMAPQFVEQVTSNVDTRTTSNIMIMNILKIAEADCKVSYPTPTSTTCDLSLTCGQNFQSTSLLYEVGNNGSVIVPMEVPLDVGPCLAELKFFDNQYPSLSTTISFNITDNLQLQSCKFTSSSDNIFFLCEFSKLSNLWGCGAVAVNLEANQNYTSCNTSASSLYGKIENVINGNYQVRCYGLDSNYSTISYHDSPSHMSMIEVTPSSSANYPTVCSTSTSNNTAGSFSASKKEQNALISICISIVFIVTFMASSI